MKKLFILFTLLLQLLSPIYPQQAATVITPSLKYGKPSKELFSKLFNHCILLYINYLIRQNNHSIQ